MSTKKDLDEYLQECVRIEPIALSEEFVRMPADFAYWSEQYKCALEKFLLEKARLDQLEAAQFLIAANAVNPATAKPYSVDGIKALVETDDQVMACRQEFILAEVEVARLKGVLEAIRTKRDMLVQLGAQVRQEMQQDPMVRNRAENERFTRGG